MNTEIKNNIKKTAVWAITESGFQHGLSLAKNIDNSILFISESLLKKLKGLKKLNNSFSKNPVRFVKLSEKLEEVFKDFDAHIFIFSTGIAVRIIAPLLKSKTEDPAIVVLDDNACHAVSLLSGHIGGANELAKKVGVITKARPVITTATDVHNKPAIDIIALQNNMYIANPEMIKKINMALLENRSVKIHDPLNILFNKIPNHINDKHNPDIICTDMEIDVPRGTLVLNPPSLIVGIGCNRGTRSDEIEKFLLLVLKQNKLSIKSIWAFASIDAKQDEIGFLELSKKYKAQFIFIDKQKLSSVTNIKTPSQTVQKHMGVKNVCEAAAIIAGKNTKLIVQKQIKGNVTIAIARQNLCCI
ncbi:MAG: cobalamin biosynthesis protein [Desulfobacteraceae bacterium]|nr:cobalamin biosynthesis protein [Desulfobacteraceae bacterium]MCK5541462.1 cobalamin biosynthesis protein [Desulfobacterales bacterium]